MNSIQVPFNPPEGALRLTDSDDLFFFLRKKYICGVVNFLARAPQG